MKKLLIILFFLPLFSQGATIYKILSDTVFVGSIPYRTATGELLLFNATKDTTGVLYNTGNGITEFKKVRLIRQNDSTYVLKIGTSVIGDTIKIRSTSSGGGSGTVTNFLFTNANGVSGVVSTSTTTPTLTLSLGAITPTTIVASGAISGSNLSGTNTGDQNLVPYLLSATAATTYATITNLKDSTQNLRDSIAYLHGLLNTKQASGSYLTVGNNLSDVSSASTSRTNLGGTTIGINYFTLTNPSAITFPRMNADNTITARSASGLKSDLSLDNVENTALSTWAGSANITTLGTIGTGTWNATTIGTTKGGTGLTSYTTGDIIYASATNVLSKLAVGSNTQVLTLAGGVPTWAAPSSGGWGLTGNASTSESTNFIGTTDSVGFVLRTNNQKRFSVRANGFIDFGNFSTLKSYNYNFKGRGDGTNNLMSISAADETILMHISGGANVGNCNIGIGYVTPSERLVVSNSTNTGNSDLGVEIRNDKTTGQGWGAYLKLNNTGSAGKTWSLVSMNASSGTFGGASKFFISDDYSGGSGTTKFCIMSSNGNVGINQQSPDASAKLEIVSTTSGILIPKGTTANRNAISTPATLLQFGNTTLSTIDTYDGTRWTNGAKFLTNTATLDFPNTAAGVVSDLTITVTGAADGDAVMLGVPNSSTVAAGSFSAWVSSANTVSVRYANNALVTSYDPASGTFKVTVNK